MSVSQAVLDRALQERREAVERAERAEAALRLVQATPAPTDDDGACWYCLSYINSGDAHNDGCPYQFDLEAAR